MFKSRLFPVSSYFSLAVMLECSSSRAARSGHLTAALPIVAEDLFV